MVALPDRHCDVGGHFVCIDAARVFAVSLVQASIVGKTIAVDVLAVYAPDRPSFSRQLKRFGEGIFYLGRANSVG